MYAIAFQNDEQGCICGLTGRSCGQAVVSVKFQYSIRFLHYICFEVVSYNVLRRE